MLNDFNFLDETLAYEIVIENTNRFVDLVDEIEVIIDTHGVPFAPKIDNSEKTVTDLVFNKVIDIM